ncbi:hypothetical protein GLOIN_2v1869616 [Rhizophagus clarus]|uniref:Uncharacterized protein n=1 Tax=Rhizophagus clarus TaxID=94130 RepID=A0A8H3KS57_9GLOM|nr:hypothetical protein GLOIN_2v1869616 [Rhizophagus clarus]
MESEIDLLRQENARLVAKNYELEAEIVKLRQIIEENARRDVRVEELEQKNTELEVRLAILEQSSLVMGEQPQNDKEVIVEVLPEVTISNIDLSNTAIDQRNNVDTKTSEEVEMDAFLVEVNKKNIGDKIRERRREKKVQHKTITKDSSSVTSDLTHCEEDLSMTSAEPVTLPEQVVKESTLACKSVTSGNKSPVKSSMVDKQAPTSENIGMECQKIPYNQKMEQDLRQELSFTEVGDSKINKAFDIQIPELSLEAILMGSSEVTPQNIVDLFRVAMKLRRKEILYWYCYYKAYEDRVGDVKSKNGVDDKSARTLVYSEIKPLLPDITDVNLRKITFRAKKIYILFDGIGINRIQIISCSVSAISNLSDNQIQDIINDFSKKATNTDDVGYENFVPNWNGHVTSKPNKTEVHANPLEVSSSASVSSASQPKPTYD